MAEETVVEAKEAPSTDQVMDKILDEAGVMDGIADTSTAKEGSESEGQDTGVDLSKKANLDKEAKSESSPEDKLAKIKEILGDDEKAIDAYIKSKGYHTDPAWQKLLAKLKTPAIDEETLKSLDEFKRVTASREYVETKMKSEGYKQEAIDAELKRRGFDVESKTQDDVELVIKNLGLDPKGIDDNTKATISDIAKVFDVLYKDRIGKTLPDSLKPLQEGLTNITRKDNAQKLTSRMKSLVSEEGVLDFDKDISPAISEWLGQNPKATQEDVFSQFLLVNHQLSLERLKTGKKRADNQEVKKGLRSNMRPLVATGEKPKKTGEFHEDADSFLDSIGYQ